MNQSFNVQRQVKPVIPTYIPQESRHNSNQKEKQQIRHVTSCSQIRYQLNYGSNIRTIDAYDNGKGNNCELSQLKKQMIEMQQEQNVLNEQFQIQIKSLSSRLNNNESNIQQLFDSGILNMSNEQKINDQIYQMERKVSEFQSQINNIQNRTDQKVKEDIESIKNIIKSQLSEQEIQLNDRCQQLRQELYVLNDKLRETNAKNNNNDVMRFQQFNEELSTYLNERNLNYESTPKKKEFEDVEQKIKLAYRSQLSAITEKTLEDSRILEQSLTSNQLIDENGFILVKGQYLLDNTGQKYQLTPEQLKYLQQINVLEEIK